MTKEIVFLFLIILVVSCAEQVVEQKLPEIEEIPTFQEETPILGEAIQDVVEEEEEEEETTLKTCQRNKDCEEDLKCIDNSCQVLADLYEIGCQETCTIAEVTLTTSDEETYKLAKGRGSYSYAGALEWRIKSTPNYCQGEEPLVPIELIKKNYGEILERQIITLNEGETSDLITHPTSTRVQFTTTIESIQEVCS